MRTSPIAFLPHSLADRVALARQQAALTHTHAQAQDGAAMQCAAVAVAAATASAPMERLSYLAQLEAHVWTPEFRTALDVLHTAAQEDWTPAQVAVRLGNDITARGSVPSAVAAFLLNADDVRGAITFAIRMGGDTDTVAAMAGAIAGARTGSRGMDDAWLHRLEDVKKLRSLADTLAALRR